MIKIFKKFTSWSFSRYSDYKLCPYKAGLKHLLRIIEPPNKAMDRGAKIHDDAASYLKKLVRKLPESLTNFTSTFRSLRNRRDLIVEETWAFTRDWKQTVWNDWTNCWVRIKVDCAYFQNATTMVIKDWKTGKFRIEEADFAYREQLELYALAGFLLFPKIKKIKCELVYLDEKHVFPMEFTRDQAQELMVGWMKRIKPMVNDSMFPTRPNNKCVWCYYRKENKKNGGGQCKY